MPALFLAVALAKEVRNTCIGQHGNNAVTAGKHSWSKRSSHLVCQSCTCASIVRSAHDKCGYIDENSQRKGSGTVHCPAGEMFHLDSLLVPDNQEIRHYNLHILKVASLRSVHREPKCSIVK